MAEIRWTQQAAQDLEGIVNFIAVDSENYARLVARHIVDAVEKAGTFPGLGRVVPEASNPEIREIIFGNYRIIYRASDGAIVILTIYHGARLLNPETLGEKSPSRPRKRTKTK